MRLIDADDAVKRLREAAEQMKVVTVAGCKAVDIYAIPQFLEMLPTIDAVPVVRCAECIHRGKPIENDYGVDVEFSEDSKCPFNCEDPWYSMRMEDDFYCPIGERRSE